MAPLRGVELPRAFPNSRIASFKLYSIGKELQKMQNRRGMDWMQQLGATKEGRGVTHVALSIEHRDEHSMSRSKQSLQGLYRSWRFQEGDAHRYQDYRHMKMVRLSALQTGALTR
jgi:hypothetical protein